MQGRRPGVLCSAPFSNYHTMPTSTSKKIRTLQEQAAFYLDTVEGKVGRQWWQTMNPARMKEKCLEFLKSENVNQLTKDQVLTIIEKL